MTEPASVLVVGTGAVGGYFGACLVRAGHGVDFVARGPNLDALRSRGLRVSGAMGDFELGHVNASEAPVEGGAYDLALLCVKNYDLADAARVVAGAGRHALTLQNGVDAPKVAREVLGDVVVAGTTGIVADLPEPGIVNVISSYAWIRFGEPLGGGVSERVHRIASILDVEGIEPIPVEDARVALWEKMALMCGMAGLTTLTQRPLGEILSDAMLRTQFEAIVKECETIATTLGVPLPDDFFGQRVAYAEGIDVSAMSSMSRDFARGKRIELETFNGAIVRMGAELGLDVPANRAVYEEILAI